MPQRIVDVIPTVVRSAAGKRQALQRLQQQWERLVGQPLARHAKPCGIRRNTLYVAADEPGASFLLSLEIPRLLERLRWLADHRIDEIVVRPWAAPHHDRHPDRL